MQNVTEHTLDSYYGKTKAERDFQEMCNLYLTLLPLCVGVQ